MGSVAGSLLRLFAIAVLGMHLGAANVLSPASLCDQPECAACLQSCDGCSEDCGVMVDCAVCHDPATAPLPATSVSLSGSAYRMQPADRLAASATGPPAPPPRPARPA